MKEMKREKHASYSSHNSCKSLSEELRDYYEGMHRSHLRPHSHRREKKRKPQEVNINLPYFHGKDNVEANLDWEIRVEQQLKKKSTSKSYGSHSYPNKYQGQDILVVTPSKPKDVKGNTIEKQAPKASMQEKTSSIKCFKCLGRGHITSQCLTTKTMILRGQDIYSSQDKATTSPSSSESEKAKGEESSEEIYPQEEGQPLVVKEKCKEVSVSCKRLAKKETHFTIKTNIKETFPLRQPPHFLFCKKTLARIATPLGLEFIPQVKKLLDEGLVRKSLNPCALVPKIGIIRHQVPKIGGMMNVLSGATLFCKITRAPDIFMLCVHRDPLGVEGRSPEYEEPQDLSSFFHGLFPSGRHLLSPLLLCLPLHLHGGKSPLKNLIEAQRSSLHRSPTSKLPSDVLLLVKEHLQELQFTLCKASIGVPGIEEKFTAYNCYRKKLEKETLKWLKKGKLRSFTSKLVHVSLHCCLEDMIYYDVMVLQSENKSDAILPRMGPVPRAMSKRLQEDWARAAEEGPRVLMNLREGKINNTRMMFDKMPEWDIGLWTTMITGYLKYGMIREATKLFDRRDAKKNVVTWTTMVNGYIKFNQVKEAGRLFYEMPLRDIVS
ncbi:Pentatricopeptide repeat-containing protein, mitochondrial [Glycine soja]